MSETAPNALTWPKYAELGDKTFVPHWLLESVDQLAAHHGSNLRAIDVQLWGVAEYNDNHNVNREGLTCLIWEDQDRAPSEDDLDHIPAVRRMERKASSLWDYVPVVLDDQGSIPGDFKFVISNEELELTYDDWNETHLTARATFGENKWRYFEQISFFPHMSETARATLCVDNALEEIDFGSEWDHDKIPKPEAVEWDDDCLVVTFAGGFFAAYKGEGE